MTSMFTISMCKSKLSVVTMYKVVLRMSPHYRSPPTTSDELRDREL